MARYCFYCGRELDDYERCDCRSRTFASQPPKEEDASKQTSQTWQEDKTEDQPPAAAWKHRVDPVPPRKRTRVRASHPPLDRAGLLRSFFQFFTSPLLAMDKDLDPAWTASHSLWLASSSLLGGLHYLAYNRKLTVWLGGASGRGSALQGLLAWLTGSVLIALVLLLYTLALWLLSRYLFRQGGLPFLHALAAGKSCWKYVSFFLILALPSLFSGAAAYGITLAVTGLVFGVLVQARQVARLTYLDENRSFQLSFLSIIFFASLFSAFTALSRLLSVFS